MNVRDTDLEVISKLFTTIIYACVMVWFSTLGGAGLGLDCLLFFVQRLDRPTRPGFSAGLLGALSYPLHSERMLPISVPRSTRHLSGVLTCAGKAS